MTKEKLYAMLSVQGTACDETVLRESEYTAERRASMELMFCNRGTDCPIAGTWCDVTDNEACQSREYD